MMRALIFTLALLGCGDGGTGQPFSFNPPNRGGTTPFAGTGSDRQAGTDRGGGTTSAIGGTTSGSTDLTDGPDACDKTKPCARGTCTSSSGGFCKETCGTQACPAGFQCLTTDVERGTEIVRTSVCYLTCATTADCPNVSGLVAQCVLIAKETPMVCNWARPQTPS